MNGGACGLIRQSACNLTSVGRKIKGIIYLIVIEIFFNGTAWLSSVRVVECNIQLFNERNLLHNCFLIFLLKITSYFFYNLLNETF